MERPQQEVAESMVVDEPSADGARKRKLEELSDETVKTEKPTNEKEKDESVGVEDWKVLATRQTFPPVAKEDQQHMKTLQETSGDVAINVDYLRPVGSSNRYHKSKIRPNELSGENQVKLSCTQKKKRRRTQKNNETDEQKHLRYIKNLCFNIATRGVCERKNCKYSHDAKKFLEVKEKDLGERCYRFEKEGYCSSGLTCRFASSHISPDFRNVVLYKPLDIDSSDEPINKLSIPLRSALRKRKVPFPKFKAFKNSRNQEKKAQSKQQEHKKEIKPTTEQEKKEPKKENQKEEMETEITGESTKQQQTTQDQQVQTEQEQTKQDQQDQEQTKQDQEQSKQELVQSKQEKEQSKQEQEQSKQESKEKGKERMEEEEREGEEIIMARLTERERKDSKNSIHWNGLLYLAPLTTLGNLPFRRICKGFGADITCGEMALASKILQGSPAEWALLKKHRSEDIFGVQICGAQVDSMTRCAELLTSEIEADFIDINAGCPIDLVTKTGAGSALVERKNRLEGIVRGMDYVMDKPLTIKMRIGKTEEHPIAHNLVPNLASWGCSAIAIHGRSRVQRYTREANWEYLAGISRANKHRVPIIGNGDIYNWEQAKQHQEEHNIGCLMIGRSALIKPWIFQEIKEQRHIDISSSERFEMLQDFTNYGLYHWGSDTKGVANVRDFLLQWLSFLYRYIPIGLVEAGISQINQRPPSYFGRNDLETLMMSDNVSDWITITEMLLGPVKDSFNFTPKHVSNAYTPQG